MFERPPLKNIAHVIPQEWQLPRAHRPPLVVKFGVDPTAPDLHLGHWAVLRVLSQLQSRGHRIVFLVGDATARIGDPSGRNKTRPMLSKKEIQRNVKTYLAQVGQFLNLKTSRIMYNSQWFDKMHLDDLIALAQHVTVSQIIERADFAARLKTHTEIALHELFYPLMQAYDSVQLHADVEIGGTDQLFNMSLGRQLQRKFRQKPQTVLGVELLVGTDGVKKMSKSYANSIGVTEPPNVMFAKIMRTPDEAILQYARLLTDMDETVLVQTLKAGANPRDVKVTVAKKIVAGLYTNAASDAASEQFIHIFSEKNLPQRIPSRKLTGSFDPRALLVALKLAASKSQAERLILQGGVKIDGQVIMELGTRVTVKDGMLVQKGKRAFVRIRTDASK